MNILTVTLGLVVAAFGSAEDNLGDPTQNGNILSRIEILERTANQHSGDPTQNDNILSRIEILERTVNRHSLELAEIRSEVSEIVRGRRAATEYSCITEKQKKGKKFLIITCPTKFQNKDVTISRGNLFLYSGVSTGINGKGNIVVGATNISKETHPGSHNIMVGESNTYTSHGGFVAGFQNTISAPHATVTGGSNNTASGVSSSVTGGTLNVASGTDSVVGGGESNAATGPFSYASGGHLNTASNQGSSVNGGSRNKATGGLSSVSGGVTNIASATYSTVVGGNAATADTWYHVGGNFIQF